MLQQFQTAFWGFVTGDALGVPHEFKDRSLLIQMPVNDMEGYGTYDQPAGTWSDDSSMMLCSMENLYKKGSSSDLTQLFIHWYTNGYNTPYGVCFDIGNTTRSSLEHHLQGKPISNEIENPYNAGNGVLMRILPYAFLPENTDWFKAMQSDHQITHKNTLSELICTIYIKTIHGLINGKNLELAHKDALKLIAYKRQPTIINSLVNEAFRNLASLNHPDFRNFPMSEITSSGYVRSTYEAVLWCLFNTHSYEEAVLKAVNLGGDTDTIAAITGGMAALIYGMDAIPTEWLEKLANKKLLEEKLKKFQDFLKYYSEFPMQNYPN